MKRVIKIGAIFAIIQIVESGVGAWAENTWSAFHGKGWISDVVIYLVFGVLLVLLARTNLVLAFAAGACVGMIDALLGTPLEHLVRSKPATTPLEQTLLAAYSIVPMMAAIITAIGALIATPFVKRDAA